MIKSILKLKKTEFDSFFVKKEHKLIKTIRTDLFDLKVFESPTLKSSIIISKKTFKRAIDRNKTKRRFYTIFAFFIKNNILKDNVFVFYPKKPSLEIEFSKLEKEVYNSLINIK